MRRRLLIASLVAGMILVSIAQESFVSALGTPFDRVQLPLYIVLFAVSIFEERVSFYALVLSILVRGLIATEVFVALIVIASAIYFLLIELHSRLLTNRTIYSVLALSIAGWSAFTVSDFLLRSALSAAFIWPNASSVAVSFILLIAFTVFSYMLAVLVSKRIRSYFIVTSRA